jgi:hypothetical protein
VSGSRRPPIRIEPDRRFYDWHRALEERHMADLTFQEVRRGVQALSAGWVEARGRGFERTLQGAGKRAAFALFYAPLHYLLVRGIVDATRAAGRPLVEILDLGCGTGVAGAAWASAFPEPPRLRGIDRNAWALGEARWSWARLGISGTTVQKKVVPLRLPRGRAGIVAAFTVNELSGEDRAILKDGVLSAADRGGAVLVVEPVARRAAPWWEEWEEAFRGAGGSGREWRFEPALPESLRLMDRAAGLDHRLLTARSLWLDGRRESGW